MLIIVKGVEMESKNNSGLFALLAVIVVILVTLGALLATGAIKFKSDSSEDSQQSTNNNQQSNDVNENAKSSQDIYSDIINEYKTAIHSNKDDNMVYKYVNENAMNHYYSQKGTEDEFNFEYSFYDINKDGIEELLINNYIIDIFSYDGSNVIRLFSEDANCLSETRCSINLYDDGTIYFSGSGGAANYYIGFYNINQNSSTLNTINSYLIKYGNDGSTTIYDEDTYDFNNDTGTKLDYSSDKELLNANIHNANKIDLNSLNWTNIN